jgi:glycosyltransferase involved in cell wall biosynthesis
VARALNKLRPKLREQFGWKLDEKFILHVGRHANAKNLRFALDIFHQIVILDPSVRFILAGSGELTEQLKEQAIQLGISNNIAFLGNRSDVFDLMVAADLMLFPSLYEGLPVTIVEAQACALRILMSNTVTNEVCVVPDLIQTLSLDEEIETWAKRAIQMLNLPTAEYLLCQHAVSRTDFNVDRTVDLLDKLYQS